MAARTFSQISKFQELMAMGRNVHITQRLFDFQGLSDVKEIRVPQDVGTIVSGGRQELGVTHLKMYRDGYHGFGTDNAAEKPEQDKMREDCFRYKVDMARRLYEMGGKQNVQA